MKKLPRLIVLCVVLTGVLSTVAAGRTGAPGPKPQIPADIKLYPSPYYNVYTDVDPDSAREAVMRMTRMAEAYHERTASFSGAINRKFDFYLFNTPEEYYAAGGMPKSAGVFNGRQLMATAFKHQNGKVGPTTWHVVQHEGFHQFAAAVIGGDIPMWVNEGLAEYFGEGIYTGDGFETGLIPAGRLKRVQETIKAGKFKAVVAMMQVTNAQWNSEMDRTNYDQAWSMVHFLAHAEKGKYQSAFGNFMVDVGRRRPWARAWEDNFGSSEGFEQRWREYWLNLPDNPTIDGYAKALVATFTSFLARSYSQKQTFDSFDDFIKTPAENLKTAKEDWLPASMFTDSAAAVSRIGSLGATFAFTKAPNNRLPEITCTLKDGTKVIGRFTLRGERSGTVTTTIVNAPTAKPLPKH